MQTYKQSLGYTTGFSGLQRNMKINASCVRCAVASKSGRAGLPQNLHNKGCAALCGKLQKEEKNHCKSWLQRSAHVCNI